MKQKYWARASYGTNRHSTVQAIIFTLFNNICTQANLQIFLLNVQNGEWEHCRSSKRRVLSSCKDAFTFLIFRKSSVDPLIVKRFLMSFIPTSWSAFLQAWKFAPFGQSIETFVFSSVKSNINCKQQKSNFSILESKKSSVALRSYKSIFFQM